MKLLMAADIFIILILKLMINEWHMLLSHNSYIYKYFQLEATGVQTGHIAYSVK